MIRSACETRPEITTTVYESLVAYSPKFDRLTKSKTIEDLYSLLSTTQIPSIISFLTTKILSKTAAEGEKKWYIDQILVILRQPSRQQDAVEQGLEFFCREGFFVSSTLTKSDKTVLRERLFSLLANLISDKDEVWATRAVMMVEKMEDEGAKKVIKLDSEIKKIRKAGLKTMKKLRSQVTKTTIPPILTLQTHAVSSQ
jgi:DNA polymerase phi